MLILLGPSGGIERYARQRFQLVATVPGAELEQGRSAEASEDERQVKKQKVRFPVCFFALPLPALLRLSSQEADDMLWRLEMHAFASLAMGILLALHELCTLIYLAMVVPLTFGYAFWPASCRSSKAGRRVRNVGNVLQALTFPLLLGLVTALTLAPSLLYWQPEEGWLNFDQLEIQSPARRSMPTWIFWVGQGALLIPTAGILQLLGKSHKVGYNPLRGFAGILWETLGLLTGHALLWKFTDGCLGACVRFCYRHRRTCICLGEIVLSIGVIAFFTWPLGLPLMLLQDSDTLGRKTMLWTAASLGSCVLLFHAVRITKKFWGSTTVDAPGSAGQDLEVGVVSSFEVSR
jgi:hypothetical protein